MKRVIFISTLLLLALACQKEPYSQDNDGEYLVYTSPAKDVTFSEFRTFDIADSVLVIGQTKNHIIHSQTMLWPSFRHIGPIWKN